MADRSFAVRILADAGQYLREIRTVHDETQRLSQSVEQRLQAQATAYQQVGAAATIAGGFIVTGLGLAAKAAIDWESAWAGVLKTVDASPETFAVLEQDLRELAGVLPATHAEIAAVAEAAGQLGIQAENIPEFTRVMIDMGEATNLSSDQAATSLARFMNIMGTAQGQVGNLGSAVVDLGNNYATTEAEIVEMGMRLAGAGTQIGLSEGEVLGLATALSSVGIEAEAGGSAMSKVMIDIAASVEEGGERLEQFSTVAGTSAQEFAAAWRDDPGAALAMFVQGLANAESQGQSTLGILADLEITEVRMRDALLRASSASDTFTAAMEDGNEAFEDGNALADEAQRRYETLGAQFEIVRNKVVDAAISFGETLTPAIGAALDMAGEFADFMGGLPPELQGVVTVVAGLTGAVLLLGGTALLAIPKIAEFRVALSTLGIEAGVVTTAASRMWAVLTGPAGLVALSIMAIADALTDSKPKLDEWNAAMERGATAADLLALANQGFVNSIDGFEFDTTKVSDYLDQLDRIDESGGWASLLPENYEVQFTDFANRLSNLDEALSQMDPAQAREAFDELTEGLGLSRLEAEQMLGQMPRLSGVLTDVEPAAEDAADGIEGVGDASETAAEQAQAFLDTQKETTDLWLSSVDAAAAFEQQLINIDQAFADATESGESLTAQWDEQNDRFDLSTQKGIDAHDMLSGLVEAHNANIQAMVDSGASAEELEAAQARGREEIARVAGQLDETGRAAQTYTGLLNEIPEDIATAVALETARAEAAMQGFLLRWDGTRLRVNVDTYGGTSYQVPGTNIRFNAEGGLLEFMAQGGLSPMSQIAQMVPPNTWRVVGDRTDVDEAYIPIDGSLRSQAILDETNRRMQALMFADGGFFGGYGSPRYGQPQPAAAMPAPIVNVAPSSLEGLTVMVQNPFTGEYLRGQIASIAESRIASAGQAQSARASAGVKGRFA